MNTHVAVRIKRGQNANRTAVARAQLERAGFVRTRVRRDGHPVAVWVR